MRKLAIMALVLVGCSVLIVLTLPVGLIEMLVASSGLSEAIPAAGPPLGWKARLLLAAFVAVMVIGLAVAVRRAPGDEGKEQRTSCARGVRIMGFAFAKLTALARGRNVPPADAAAPALRRADAHPDAPARAPIFASCDFSGLDIFARPESGRRRLVVDDSDGPRISSANAGWDQPDTTVAASDEEWSTPAFARSMDALPDLPSDPIPLSRPQFAPPQDVATQAWQDEPVDLAEWEDEVQAVAAEPAPVEEAMPVPPAVAPSFADRPSTANLSITELTERLEKALAQRGRPSSPPAGSVRVIADMPVASAVPVRDAVPQDVDDALRAALGTLRTMTGRLN